MDSRRNLALVTGASSGIGAALCRLLARKGINLYITGRNQERLHDIAEELRALVNVKADTFDLAIPEHRNILIANIRELKPYLIVNNAGFGLYGAALDHATKEQMELLEVDAAAVLEISLEAARTLIDAKQKGVILNVSSAAAFTFYPNFSVYAASKAFVNHFSECFDFEVSPHGIRVLAACPGMVNTKFGERASKNRLNKKYSLSMLKMTAEYAAEQIWWQIVNEKQTYVFDWKYRFMISLSSIIPKRFQAYFLKNILGKRYTQ